MRSINWWHRQQERAERAEGSELTRLRAELEDADADGFALWAWKPHALLMFVHDTMKENRNDLPGHDAGH